MNARPINARKLVLGMLAALCALTCGLAFSIAPALATGDANEAFCPNEALVGFQPALPDCRAWEQVSPTYMEGYPSQLAGISPDGSTVILESFGSFSNIGRSTADATQYAVTRGAGGWTATAISPPAATYPGAAPEELWATPDLSRTLWVMHTASESTQAANLYLGDGQGDFTLIGHMLPNTDYTTPPGRAYNRLDSIALSAASADLSHVVFDIKPTPGTPGWPGDTTIPNEISLYELVDTPGPEGTGSVEPRLVGVSNVGHLSSDSEAHLITQCGVALGVLNKEKAEQDTYNAISASGESVFFTAGAGGCSREGRVGTGPDVSELYARVAGAATIPISEPSLAVPGRECTGVCEAQETNESSRSPGLFQGASQDGSKVFFLTKQSLVNSDEGGAGESEDLYEAVIAPGEHASMTKLVQVSHDPNAGEKAEVQGVMRVSEDGSHVYFVAHGVLATNENAHAETPQPGAENFYVYNTVTETMTFIARLSELDGADWSHDDARPVDATPDGRYIVFRSVAHLTPDDLAGEAPQAFEYNSQTGEIARVSVGTTSAGPQYCPLTERIEAGYNCNGLTNNEADAPIFYRFFDEKFAPQELASTAHISADGSTVTFISADGLSPQATNANAGFCPDVYEYHSVGPITNGGVYLLSSGRDTVEEKEECGTFTDDIDASGADVFFTARDQLVPQDTNTQEDIYDARVDGGFPPASSSECAGEACQAPAPILPALATPGSTTITGTGNLAPPPPKTLTTKKITKCKKGYVKRKSKCVKARAKKKAKKGDRRAKS